MATNNPIGSNSVEDFQDNSIILDHFVNSQNESHPDRFGKQRPTITGIIKEAFSVRQDINNFTENLVGMSRWDPIPKNTSLTLGGDNGGLNKQAQALFNRTEMLKVHAKEALRRTYQEVGLVLVPGSFEDGGTLNTIADILLEEKTGKVYSWTGSFPKVVNKGTLPTSEVEFIDKSDLSGIEKHKTESVAHPISSIEGLAEALMEKVSLDQLYLENPVGITQDWPLEVPPDGWICCMGQAFDKQQCPRLAIAYPSEVLPDLRGEFIRGWDNGRGVNPDRKILSLELDELKSHKHPLGALVVTETGYGSVGGVAQSGNIYITETQLTGGNETRPRSVAMNKIVRRA